MSVYKYWILWLLLWQVASCSAKDLHCGPASSEVAAASATNTVRLKLKTEDMLHGPLEALEPSLHSYIYSGDFVGFSTHLRLLAQHENFPSLLGAIQAGDDRGMTVAHLLACAGRQQELSQLLDILFRMQGDGVEMIRKIVMESRNQDACKGKKCDKLSDRPGLYAHGTLQLLNPSQQVVLFGDVTPLECAAAHGHVHAMKLLIQGGVAPGKVFEVAQVFSLTKQLHQAIQLANVEGFLAQPKVFLLPPKGSNAQLRQPRTRRSSGGSSGGKGNSNGKNAAAVTKNKSSSQGTVKESKKATNEIPNAVVNTATSSAPGASISLASSNDSVGNSSASAETTAAPQVTKMSEMVDIAALLLLTGMLLLPLWSTICLLWRRAVRKRAAVTEPARRIKQAMFAATSGALSRTSSLGSASSTADCCPVAAATAVTSNKKGKTAAAGGTVRQRKAQASQPSSSPVTNRTTIPVLVSQDDTDSQDADDSQTADGGPGPAPDQVPVSGHSRGSRGSSPDGLDTHNVLKTAENSCSSTSAATPPAASNNSTGAAGKHKRSKPQGPGMSSGQGVLSPATGVAASRSNSIVSTSSSELSGPATPVDSLLDVSTAAAAVVAAAERQVCSAGAASTGASSACPSQGPSQPASAGPAGSEQGPISAPAAEHAAPSGMPTAALGSGSNISKRRVTGGRSLGAAAAASKPTMEISAPRVQQQVVKSVSTKQQVGNSSSSSQQSVRAKQKGAKPAAAAAATSGSESRTDGSHSISRALLQPQRTASASAAVGGYEAVVATPPQLRVLSAEDAAQTAKVYAALVAPYTPSAAAAAARPAIYQPPGAPCCDNTSPTADTAELASTASEHKQRVVSLQQQQGDDQPDDVDVHRRDQYRIPKAAAAAAAAASLTRSAAVPAPAGDVSDYNAAMHLPADAVELGSAADQAAAPVESCCSGQVNLTPTYSSGSSSSSSSGRVSSSYALQLAGSGSGNLTGSKEMTLSSNSSYAGAPGTAPVARKLSDAASVHSDTSFCSIGSPTGGSSYGRSHWQPPQPPPPPPPRAAPTPSTLAVERFGAISPFDEGLLSPPAAGTAGVIGSGTGCNPAAAAAAATAAAGGGGEEYQAGREDHAGPVTVLSGSLAAPAEVTGPAGHHPPADRSASVHADTAQLVAVVHAPGMNAAGIVDARTAQSGASSHTAASDATAVLGAADAEVAFPPRNSSSGSYQGGLNSSQAHLPGVAAQQHQQQLQPLSQNMQALASQLLHSPIQGTSDNPGQGLSPQVLAQMASTWQHQQQQQAAVRAQQQQQQQQWLIASAGQPALPQQGQQAGQLMMQPPVSTASVGSAAVHLPAGMVALMQASKSQAAVLQQRQQQQQLQQQKLMVFVPQQSGLQVGSPSGGAIAAALSPQQRAMLFCQGGGVSAMPLVQQQQQQPAAVSAAPYSQQVVYLQQQQQQQQQLRVVQLSGALQGGALRVFHPGSSLQVPQGPLAAAATAGANHGPAQVVLSPAGPGVTFVAGQRLVGTGGAVGPGPAAVQVSPMSSGMTAAAFASIATNSAGTHLSTLQRGANSASASQQLLAMVPGLQQSRQQVLPGQHVVNGKFDWTTLASELAGGPVGPMSTGTPAAYDLVAEPPGLYPPGLGQGAEMEGSPEAAYTAAASPANRGGARHESVLSIEVPEVSCDGSQHSESARMAAELDELLHQANQQLGWSGIPRTFNGSDNNTKFSAGSPGLAKTPPHTPPATTATAPDMPGSACSKLKPDAPEYQPRCPASAAAAGKQQPASEYGSRGGADDRSVHLKSLEALQLPDGFCAGD